MNKKFYFALALTAGLFASCSSDDIAQAPSLDGQEGNPNGAINLSVGNASQGSTRGTGTVGGTVSQNLVSQWAGQKVNVYMLKTGTLDQAYELKDDGTDDTTKPLYENQEMVVEPGSAALILDIAADATNPSWKDRTVTSKYFPGSGVYDFWGYRTDGAEAAAPAVNGTNLEIPFEIDGSQDLMSGKAAPLEKTGVTAADYGYWNSDKSKVYGKYGGNNVEVDPAKIYSAYSARRGIDPILSFKHQLARFTFEVKGADKSFCIAEGETDADKIAKAVNVTEIKVKGTKYKGNLVIAYTGAAPDPITWDAATTDLVLKQRVKKVVTPATGSFYGIKVVRGADDAVTGDPTYTYSVRNAAYPATPAWTNNATLVHGQLISDATEVRDAATTDANSNLPNGNQSTIAAIKASLTAANTESAEFYYYEVGNAVVYSANPDDIDMTADLVALEPVQPIKDAGDVPQKTKVGEALLLPAGETEYKIEVLLKQRLAIETKTVVDANGNVIYVNDAATPTVYYLKQPAVAAADAVFTTDDTDQATFGAAYTAAAAADKFDGSASADFAADLLTWVNANGVAATDYYAFDGTNYYKVSVTSAAVAAAAEYYYDSTDPTTAVDLATVNAVEWKTETYEDKNMLVKQTIKLANDPSTGTPMAFEAGKSYNVVLTVNGFSAVGGGTGPNVDAYVDYGTDIELNDETED